ncbi:MAG: RNA methyltransferase [Saprospiraceae bacterium]|nr:RNA methyltransferase [Bacteroidia bacterium]MBT8229684.1 RNA methyltransferase [Bacteroidia bacterium]NNF21644.1 RNA methyltransferase [Saprospiraceae bacterium]NNK90492.1 RNA methyltransferase [Saprospiraceae bacterium]
MLTEARDNKLKRVAAARQEMTVVLENVHDPHNIGAVLRTCDSVGIQEIYVLYTDERLTPERLSHFKVSSTGVKKWMHIHYFDDCKSCFEAVNQKYDKILATHLDKESKSIYETDHIGRIAYVFGNEHEGVSEMALKYCHGNILIPQYGMVQSLNISVACAVTLYEASRQRIQGGLYSDKLDENDDLRMNYYHHFLDKHK